MKPDARPTCDHDYWTRVRDVADRLGSDGCTMATGIRRDCCAEHDIAYRLGQTIDGETLTRGQADARFLACMQRRAWFGWWSPVAWTRYAAVRLFGGRAWEKGKATHVK